jgi:bile acid-coenzyme A ligase
MSLDRPSPLGGATAGEAISFGRRVSILAAAHPERTALILVSKGGEERRISWSALDRESNRTARLLAGQEVGSSSTVVVGLANCAEHFLISLAAWKLGACVIPLNPALPPRERDALLQLARPTVVVADWEGIDGSLSRSDLERASRLSADPLPDRIPHPGKAIASGGSTGRPKLIVDPSPWARIAVIGANPGLVESMGYWLGMRAGQTQLVAGPLYHNAPFTWSHLGLFEDHCLVVLERFDAALAVDAIERHRVNWGFLVPTMMHRILHLPGIAARDFSSVEAFFHAGAPCAGWLKEAWIELLGGNRLYEMYGATEAFGLTVIRGDEWLAHRGSVGRPRDSELRILDEAGRDLPVGEIGEIFMRPSDPAAPTFRYVGADPATTAGDRYVSVGDMGWVDSDGYLFLADRRADLILRGGANIYPAEVEAVLTEHPKLADVVVIGVPDEELGERVHAVVEPRGDAAPVSAEELDQFCRERLAPYKVPASFEVLAALPRQESGKIRRSALAAERKTGEFTGRVMVPGPRTRSVP